MAHSSEPTCGRDGSIGSAVRSNFVDRRILSSSKHRHSPECLPPVYREQGHVWNLDPYDVYTARPERRLTTELEYNGGAFFSADGTKIVYRTIMLAEASRPLSEAFLIGQRL